MEPLDRLKVAAEEDEEEAAIAERPNEVEERDGRSSEGTFRADDDDDDENEVWRRLPSEALLCCGCFSCLGSLRPRPGGGEHLLLPRGTRLLLLTALLPLLLPTPPRCAAAFTAVAVVVVVVIAAPRLLAPGRAFTRGKEATAAAAGPSACKPSLKIAFR